MSCRLGKLACPRINDDQKIHVDDQTLSSGRPHDFWILERLFYEILSFFPFFLAGNTVLQKKYTGGRPQVLVDDKVLNLSRLMITRFLVEIS